MKAFFAFTFALISAGGSVGPTETVTGHVLFSVIEASTIGYLIGALIVELTAWRKDSKTTKA